MCVYVGGGRLLKLATSETLDFTLENTKEFSSPSSPSSSDDFPDKVFS